MAAAGSWVITEVYWYSKQASHKCRKFDFSSSSVSFLGQVFLFFLALQVRHKSGLNSSRRFDLFKVVLAQKQPADRKRNLKNLLTTDRTQLNLKVPPSVNLNLKGVKCTPTELHLNLSRSIWTILSGYLIPRLYTTTIRVTLRDSDVT